MTHRVVDALGTWCPVPVYLIDRAARTADEGDVLELLADDPLIEVDLPAWCHTSGHELLELRPDGDGYLGRVAVTRGAHDERARPRDPSPGRSAGG